MKVFFYFGLMFSCLFCVAGEMDGKIVTNRLERKLVSSRVIPYSEEIFGARMRYPRAATLLRNLVNKHEDGSFIVFCEWEVIFTAQKANGVFDGSISVFPDGILSATAMIKKGILDGKCVMTFRPFKYSFDSKMSSVANYEFEKIPVPQDQWVVKGPREFELRSEGFFRSGRKFEGTFLHVTSQMDLRIVTIRTYQDFKLVSESKPSVFKISPWVNYSIIGIDLDQMKQMSLDELLKYRKEMEKKYMAGEVGIEELNAIQARINELQRQSR